ncbi:sulfotransferase [Sphingomonas sp. Root710]|uniref:tetratricopeptide repeat-containing sulfotransferase family protein n=1 Tax=Sphingomonas sp. Root710 TaxID=1736594 RepID=UPI0006F5754C|nr:tetratricopeptide repeat-containing sulfotransferase family protein [Sphingomonas sp. Root710]KRB82611.1 sulfotransferase [Sphingomonas sp. Root710]
MSEPTSPQLLGQIAALARNGRLDEAAALAGTAWTERQDPMLAALAGAVDFHRGAFQQAAAYLRVAHKAKPADITVRANLADALYRIGQGAEVLALCDDASMRADPSLRLARLAGHYHQEAGDYDAAATCYRLIADRAPDDWGALNNLGNALNASGRREEALDMLRKARDLAPDSAPILLNLGNTLMEAGLGDEAEAVFHSAATQFPDDPKPHQALYNLYSAAGLEDAAFDAISDAVERAPGDAELISNRGQEAARRNQYDVAEASFEAALALKPGLAQSLVGLASLYERVNREAELDPLYLRAQGEQADAQTLSFIEALRFKRAGQFEEAYDALEKAGDVIVAGRMFHLRGTVLDRLGRYDEAFASFTAMNEHWQNDPSRPRDRARDYRDAMTKADALLSPDWLASWSSPPRADPRRTPVFIVGFPRSGTTLLDTMLMADPSVLVLEEEPFLVEAENELGGIEALPGAGTEAIAAARDGYFAKIEALAGPVGDRLVVDKHPMHLNKVAIARRLFPDARFILALRHPADVLLSCAITNFRINNAMANFLDLGDAATLYDLTFRHWGKARALFDAPVHEVVYERLVLDPARELRPLFAWLGLAWPDDGVDHQQAARARGAVSTASYSQVTEPIYSRSSGRWTRYRKHLEPILPVLAPWVDRFGYALDDGRIPGWPADAG